MKRTLFLTLLVALFALAFGSPAGVKSEAANQAGSAAAVQRFVVFEGFFEPT